ncbi:MAG: phage major tail protein, TP901-1 family [Alphaproteobacteria bacterium]|nr:phage major tail protein, TP901-1 family [Alphaproteobacteria bacterium]
MAAQKGREVLIRLDIASTLTTIGGMRQKSMSLNDSQVDVTDSDSAGRWRELLAAAGVKSMSLSGSGVFKDSAAEIALLGHWNAGTHPTMAFFIPEIGTFQGPFAVNLQYQGQHDGEVQFSASFDSAGEIAFTAA